MWKPTPKSPNPVVVVAADDGLRRAVGRVLEADGYAVLQAESTESALAFAARADGATALVAPLVDDELDGWDLVRRFRSLQPGTPVLYLSCLHRIPPICDRVFTDDARFLGGPISRRRLSRQMQRLLEHRPRERGSEVQEAAAAAHA